MGVSFKKNTLSLVIVVFFIAAIFALFYDRDVKQNNILKLKNELKDFIVLPISLNNKLYTVENGDVKLDGKDVSVLTGEKVLRIAYSSVLNRIDPIFGIEGTDADKLEKSIEDLGAQLKNTASLYGKDDEKLIVENLYPIGFLKALSKTEKARQEFLLTPAYENAAEYYKDLEELIGLNASYAKQLKIVYQNNKDRLNYKYTFFDGYGTIDTYTSALDTAVPEMDKKSLELKKRKGCLSVYSPECPSLKGILDSPSTPDWKSADITYKPLTKDLEDNIKLILAYLESISFGNAGNAKTNNPLIALDYSECFRDIPTIYYQSWLKSDKNKNIYFTINFVNDLYFRSEKNSLNPFNLSLEKAGLDYLYQPGTNLYMCQSVGSDFSRSIAMDTIYNLLSGKQVSANNNIKKLAPDVYKLENKIITGGTLYESEFANYISGLEYLLSKYGEIGLSEIIGQENVLFAEKLISIYKQKSARFDETIRYVIENNSIVDAIIKSGAKFVVRYLFIMRSYPSLLLLSYNGSAYEHPMELTRATPFKLANFELFSYNKFLKGKYGAQKTLEIMQLGREIQHKEKE